MSGDGAQTYSVLEKGAFFGELGVFLDIARTASVKAIEHCVCKILTRKNLISSLKDFPEFDKRFRAVVRQRIDEIDRCKNAKPSKISWYS